MSIERLIVQNIHRDRLHEVNEIERVEPEDPILSQNEIMDLLVDFATISNKGYQDYPEGTSEKKAYREMEAKLVSVGLAIKAKEVKNPEMPGNFYDITKEGKIK